MEYKRDVRICSVHASKKKRLTKMIWGASKSAVLDVPRALDVPAQFVKMEEHNFFSAGETCNIFSDEQAPSLQWCHPDQWT